MKCPACNSFDLIVTKRLDAEIDYCPQCRGIWLSRCAIGKIIAKSCDAEAMRCLTEQHSFYAGQRSWPDETRHHDGLDKDHHSHHQKNDGYPIGNCLTKNHKRNWQPKQINE
jgi:uncharacterized protein